MKFENTAAFAQALDKKDPIKKFRSLFHLPKVNGKTAFYFTGNSLGLAPKTAAKFLKEELNDWEKLGVEGHFRAKRPWLYYHKFAKNALARLTGAKPIEVAAMHQLTVNLHVMLTTFYRPKGKRTKILLTLRLLAVRHRNQRVRHTMLSRRAVQGCLPPPSGGR